MLNYLIAWCWREIDRAIAGINRVTLSTMKPGVKYYLSDIDWTQW